MNSSSKISHLVKGIPPSGIRRFFDLILSMDNVISLGVGEPDFVTPWHIREAGVYSIEEGYTTYTSNSGLLELRTEIARYIKDKYLVSYDPIDEILITFGVSEGLDLVLRALLNPGDEVIIPHPCYVSYVPCVTLAGGIPIPAYTEFSQGFKIKADLIERNLTPRTKVLLLCYPNNPTGATLRREELLEIADLAASRDLIVVSDEIYASLTYEGEHVCFSSLPGMRERTVVLSGFSKAYAMTGWRIGYALSTTDIIEAMTKIHQYTALCVSHLSQRAAIEAIQAGDRDVKEMVEEYNHRRRIIVKSLNEIGLDCLMPDGAFYVFPSIKRFGMDDEEFCRRLLVEEKVAVVPGSAFGEQYSSFIRCSYATSIKAIEEAIGRMGRFVDRIKRDVCYVVSEAT